MKIFLKMLMYLMATLFIFSGCSPKQPDKIVINRKVPRLPIFKPPDKRVNLDVKVLGRKAIVDKYKLLLLLKNCDIYKRNTISYESINRKINKVNGYE